MFSVESIIFDLDGTLWDTCRACAEGWNNVLGRNHILFRHIRPDDIRSVAGKPHDECIRQIFKGLGEDEMQLLIRETAEEDNRTVAVLGGELYPFVLEGIKILKKHYRLFIVSNCQAGYVETFLKYADLSGAISDFECFGNTLKSKSENLGLLISRNKIKSGIYVGDTRGDQLAAREAGLPFAFVHYGFGTCESPDLEFKDFKQLVNHFQTIKA